MDFHVVEHVVAKVELGTREQRRHVAYRIAGAFEQQAMAVAQFKALQVLAWLAGELRGTDQLAAVGVRPAVQGADDVAAGCAQVARAVPWASHAARFTSENQRLSMPTDIGHQLHPAGVAHEHTAAPFVGEAPPIAAFGYGFFVADIAGGMLEDGFEFAREQGFVEIRGDG